MFIRGSRSHDPRKMKTKLVFLHGLESGPYGWKYQALRDLDPELIAPDCTGVDDLESRLRIIEDRLAGVDRMVIVGSSFGGLAALLFAQRESNRERVIGCLLCAPALPLATPGSITWFPPGTIVLHGTNDEVVPFGSWKEFCAANGIRLVAVADDHRLSQSRSLVVGLARELLQASATDGARGRNVDALDALAT